MDERHDFDDTRLISALLDLCGLLRARQEKKFAALPLFERVMRLHITMLLRVWLWAMGAKL